MSLETSKKWKQLRRTDPEYVEKEREENLAYYHNLSQEQKKERRTKSLEKIKEHRRNNIAKYMLYDAKKRAKLKGLEYDLKEEDIIIPLFCPVLGIPLFKGEGKRSANSPSLDRFNNLKGYTKENIRVISLRANSLKNDATLEELKLIVAYMEEK